MIITEKYSYLNTNKRSYDSFKGNMQILVIGLLNSPAFVFIFTALTLLSEPGYTTIIRPNNQLQTGLV
ncbi:unnamed protein product [Larinioides sclopetarius]|uniref:Uncharacterized protein n=1 Tax=Larinioides sclopetarius TaxID=280406 RepID=A0AAV2AB02_9ARAC